MSEQSGSSQGQQERTELPIERGLSYRARKRDCRQRGPGEDVLPPDLHDAQVVGSTSRLRLPCRFTLHAAGRPREGLGVRTGSRGSTLASYGDDANGGSDLDIASLLERVDISDPESLWELYPKDVRIKDKKILDPFMGGGTSLVEASRFGAEVVGNDLNPVAWFVTKKELEAGQTDVEELEEAFERVKDDVADEIKQYYKTSCPNGNHDADVMYNFWVKELDCVSCGHTVPLFKDYRVAKGRYENDDKYNVLCPDCESVIRVNDWKSECNCGKCGNLFVPAEGTAGQGDYTCQNCGQKYPILDAGQEQGGYDTWLYALEYYCETCDDQGYERSEVKGYKSASDFDKELHAEAVTKWEENKDRLVDFTPDEEIPLGIKTDSTKFEGSIGGGHNVLRHGYTQWSDMYDERQLYLLGRLLETIHSIEDQQVKEYLLLAFSDSLMFNNTFTIYNLSANKIEGIYKTNSFDPELDFVENNIWGAKYRRGTFKKTWEKLLRGVGYAHNPTERFINDDGESMETDPFDKSIGENSTLHLGDARDLDFDSEFDAVISDPPYYDNVIYSELSDFFYVWLKQILESEYEGFKGSRAPHAESIVANPAEGKGSEEFEEELRGAFETIRTALKDDGVFSFTYHHSDSESWGELLQALCDVGFEVTATYPINSDLNRLFEGESVSFDIIVIARPCDETEAASWNTLRRSIYRTARNTRRQLEANRQLSRGDIGVMEMGACFREYSKHHGKVQRDGEIMDAKEVVQEIYGIIQEASDIGVEDVFIDLLDTANVSYDDVNKLCRGTNATPEDLTETRLYNTEDGFELGTWNNEKRQAYIQERVNGDGGDHLSNLDKLQFLRYRYEKGQAVQNYVEKWDVDDDLRELAGRLADVTGDDTYTRVLGDRDITSY